MVGHMRLGCCSRFYALLSYEGYEDRVGGQVFGKVVGKVVGWEDCCGFWCMMAGQRRRRLAMVQPSEQA